MFSNGVTRLCAWLETGVGERHRHESRLPHEQADVGDEHSEQQRYVFDEVELAQEHDGDGEHRQPQQETEQNTGHQRVQRHADGRGDDGGRGEEIEDDEPDADRRRRDAIPAPTDRGCDEKNGRHRNRATSEIARHLQLGRRTGNRAPPCITQHDRSPFPRRADARGVAWMLRSPTTFSRSRNQRR